jgi:hypothetical protein
MTQRLSDYPVDLVTLLCACGHRIVEHNPRAVRTRPCLLCPCRTLTRQPHP